MKFQFLKYLILIIAVFIFIGIYSFINQSNFLQSQLKFARVKSAYNEKFKGISENLKKLNVNHSNFKIYLIAYKKEKQLEIYVSNSTGKYTYFKTYQVCSQSGELGPKFMYGDNQTPEGFYSVDRFNPSSNFLLSLGLNYPNKADKIRSKAKNLGGDIFIHGSCVSIGCLAMTDKQIQEIYLLAVLAKNYGQKNIPVVIAPFKFDKITSQKFKKEKEYSKFKQYFTLWGSIEKGINQFNKNNMPPQISIDKNGNYLIQQ